MARSRTKPKWVKEIALKKVKQLISLAEKEEKPELRKRYAELAKKTAMKYNVKLPKEYRKRICPNCGEFLVPGENLKIRTSSKTKEVLYICQKCGETQKMGYSREKKAKT